MLIDNILQKYHPVQVQDRLYYVSTVKKTTYININSLATKNFAVNKWTRGKQTKNLLKTVKDSLVTQKNKGSWLHSTLFNDFKDWLNQKADLNYDSIETILQYKNHSDPLH